ncbi:MAG: orotidine-5'-phosphate decarboxylase [Pseudomonadota bacterium]|nr:orotidine-5'-phosphate decarboxylase [Pseudomonadota bacterium]MEC9236547.1 orotidine-5'-phosphate decarboxylase [Pseudomonadota bacterium]MED5423807.1 orotidine-5'-phosphate decarboxylase [Pseudomonadota bacterium]
MTILPKIYCACDVASLDQALTLTNKLKGLPIGIKLGLEFFMAEGLKGVGAIRDKHPDTSIFLDLKFHDIPNTVASALRVVSDLGVDYTNLHASGGLEMMQRALDAVNAAHKPAKLLAVTVLTALNDQSLNTVGQQTPVQDQVLRLAKLTKQAGLAGVVCSAHEIDAIRSACGAEFALMTPGIRPVGSANDDQKRVMTPRDALSAGATHLVIGRPITQAADPRKAAEDILESIAHG